MSAGGSTLAAPGSATKNLVLAAMVFAVAMTFIDPAIVALARLPRYRIQAAEEPAARVEREKQAGADAALVVDLRKLEFIDLSGLNVLLRGYCQQGERSRSVLGAVAARLVDVIGLRDKLSIIDEETRHG